MEFKIELGDKCPAKQPADETSFWDNRFVKRSKSSLAIGTLVTLAMLPATLALKYIVDNAAESAE